MVLPKKSYLNWEDRTAETSQNISSEEPIAIPQFYATMIHNF